MKDKKLIAELNQALNGYANGGPLSTPLATPSETAIRNVQAAPNKVVTFDQYDQYNQYSDDDCDCEDGFDCDCGDMEDDFSCDEDDFTQQEEQLFSRFKDWLMRNSQLMSSPYEDEERGEASDLPEAEDSTEDNLDMDGDIESDVDGVNPDEDPNDEGIRRTIKGAHLVYKRKQPDGYFEELWFYNIGKDSNRDEMDVKRDILAATDIPPNATHSEDGTQEYSLWTVGNGQMLCIRGVPN